MKWTPDKNPSRSINYYLKVLLVIIVIILLINIFVSALTISITRKQSIDNITNTLDIYLENAKSKLNAIDHFMIWTVLNEPLLDEMEKKMDMKKFPKNIANFRTRVNDLQYTVGKEFQFFLGLKKENYFFNASTLRMDYQNYLQVKDHFFTKSDSLETYEMISTWKSIEVNDTFYLYHVLSYENRIFICLISVEDILQPLNNINLGNDGFIVMEKDGVGILPNNKQVNTEEKNSLPFFTSKLLFDEKNTSLPFHLRIYVDHFGAFKHVVITQVILIVATTIITIILFFILRYIKNRLINPIQKFSKNLAEINNNNDFIDFQSSSIIELEQANVQFRQLIQEIKKLKVNIYEQQLERKKTEMDFLRLQIKPHFYINCLSTIYSMAEMHRYEEIKEMALSTSRYFRYLFQSNQNFVPIKKEMDHIRDYLAIQQLLHGPTFHFDTSVDPKMEDAKIPPLILQTFIENTIKHGSDSDEDELMMISMNIHYTWKDQYLKITIKDNGPGYPKEILRKLQHNIPVATTNGRQIGINNVIQRLRLLYGDDFSIYFSNASNHGAIVELVIPYQVYEE